MLASCRQTLLQRLSRTNLSCEFVSMFVRADFLLLVVVSICINHNQDIQTIVITQRDISVSCRICNKAAHFGALTSTLVLNLVKGQMNGFIQQCLQVCMLLLSFTLCFLLRVQGGGRFCQGRQRRIVLTRSVSPVWHFHAFDCVELGVLLKCCARKAA